MSFSTFWLLHTKTTVDFGFSSIIAAFFPLVF